MADERTVTSVVIAGEEYTIRTEASQEHTRECARYVDSTIDQIMSRGSLVEAHKAAILAALAIADQLFQERKDAEALRATVAERSSRLLEEIDDKLPSSGLASAD